MGVMAPSTISVAEALNDTGAPVFDVALALIASGSLSAGGLVSTTVIRNDSDAVLPALSTAVQRTIVLPSVNVAPDALLHVGDTGPSTRSRAETAKGTAVPVELVASDVIPSVGTLMTGAVVSCTTTLKLSLR